VNVTKGEGRLDLRRPPPRPEQPEPDQRLVAAEAAIADACRALARAARYETRHRREILGHAELLELLGRAMLKEASR
jgi:hypothetical protein